MSVNSVLQNMSFGERIAEEDNQLESYFVETNQWRRIFKGEIDVIYGPKGAGKSAFYYLLLKKREELRRRGTILIAGENPRGATAFQDLAKDPPTSEFEFIGIWKLYIAVLVGMEVEKITRRGEQATALIDVLKEAGLMKSGSLEATLRAVRKYVRSWTSAGGIEGEVKIDPATGMPVGVVGRITLKDTGSQQEPLPVSLDDLIRMANEALAEAGLHVWVMLDRLDIAFADSRALEENALRALFKVYLDFRRVDHIELKIFLRDDIWKRITSVGFREASHITRSINITWDNRSLLNLIVRRAIQNGSIQAFYSETPEQVTATHDSQEQFFYKLFPKQVEKGKRRPTTFDWLLSRTCDGTKYTAPRELIHLLNSSIQKQLEMFDIGGYEPEGNNLVAGAAMKEALPEVSKVRLEQTLYAEYPSLKTSVEKLRGEKTSQTVSTLSTVLALDDEDASVMANELVSVGLFEQRGEKHNPEFWVPFLYRDALDMVQGSATGDEADD
jgi:hypothetical protein